MTQSKDTLTKQEGEKIRPLCIECSKNLVAKIYSHKGWTGKYFLKCGRCQHLWRRDRNYKNEAEYKKRLRERHDKDGMCPQCGRNRDKKTKHCLSCCNKNKLRRDKNNNVARANGFCYYCKKNVALIKNSLCEICNLKQKSCNIWNTRKRWVDLKLIWDKQKGICPYTKRKLEIPTSEIDHIIPKSKGGDDSVDNLEFVLAEINHMKGKIMRDKFLSFIKEVYEAQWKIL